LFLSGKESKTFKMGSKIFPFPFPKTSPFRNPIGKETIFILEYGRKLCRDPTPMILFSLNYVGFANTFLKLAIKRLL